MFACILPASCSLVVRVQKTGDGAYYEKGIRKFCQGYTDMYQKFFEDSQANFDGVIRLHSQ